MNDWLVAAISLPTGYLVGQLLPFKIVHQETPVKRDFPLDKIALAVAGVLIVVFAVSWGQQRTNDRDDDRRQSEIVGCIADWATKFDNAQRQRTEANTAKDKARDDFLLAAGGLLQTDMASEAELEATRTAFVEYRRTTRDLDQARSDYPYPAFPPTGCGR